MRPDVSILIPCFNAERFVGEAIDSALAQSEACVEVIVVDDGSTDGSLDEIRRFGDRIRWESGPNRGGGAARNRLLAMATAPWIQYLDADDYLEPRKVSDQLAHIADTRDDTDILFSGVRVEHIVDGEVARVDDGAIDAPSDPWSLLALWRLPQTGGPLWSRAALESVGAWKEDQPCCQEHELYLRLLMAGKRFRHAPEIGAVYRRFADGTVSTRNMTRVRKERLAILARMEAFLAEHGDLTPDRQKAINQGRFDMARSAWSEDRDEAREIFNAVRESGAPFSPEGAAAPALYRTVFNALGFEMAEHVAAAKRALQTALAGRPT